MGRSLAAVLAAPTPSDALFLLVAASMVAAIVVARRRAAAAAAVYVCALPLVDLPATRNSALAAVVLLGLAPLALAIAVAHERWAQGPQIRSCLRAYLWPGLLLLWAAVGCAVSAASRWREWWILFRLVATAVVLSLAALDPAVRRALAAAFVLSAGAVSAVAMVQFAWGRFFWSIGRTRSPGYDFFIEVAPGVVRAPGTFTDPNTLGIWAGLGLLVVVAAIAQAPSRSRRRLVAVALGAVLLGGLVVSFTRSAALAVGFGLAVLAWRGDLRNRRRWALLAASLTLAVLVAGVRWYGSSLRPTTIGSVEHRMLYWKAAVAMARDHPLVGVGLGGFSQQFPSVTAELPRKVAAMPRHRPHSVLLGLAAETGLVGLTLFVAFFVRPVRLLLARRDLAARLALAVLSAMLLHACLHNVWLQDLFWAVAALAVAVAAAPGPAAALSVPDESSSEGRRHASEIGQLPR